ncbi:S8 family serine peptidase [bacterium]|nr:S8 family serine peptidase [bacterium]
MSRLKQTPLLTALACLALLCCGCGRGSAIPSAQPISTQTSTASPFELRATDSICVTYRDDAEFLALPPELMVPSGAAQSASNAILRPRRAYEDITQSIASRYGLTITEQVYSGRVLLAGFNLPEGTDAPSLLADLHQRYAGWVSTAELSLLCSPAFSPDDPEYTASADDSGGQWNLKHMHIEQAWEHGLGSDSLLLGLVDTGVNMDHSEFGAALLDPAVEFPGTNCDIANDDSSIEDNHGHGTFIGGQLIAESDNGSMIAGACPGIRLFPVKISDDGGNEDLERIVAGCMLAHALGAKVISMSWGGGGNEAMQAMTEQFAADGVLLVCSAGNYGNGFVTYPGAYPDAIAVGNSLPDESRFVSSSFGPALNVVAPGWNLSSLSPSDDNGMVSGGTGTSYATPLVSAAAALLWSARPELSLTEMRGLLETSGVPTTGFGEGVQVLRLDFGLLFDNAVNPAVRFSPPERIVQHGSMPLSFMLRGEPQALDIRLDGKTVALLDGPVWEHELSLDGVPGGSHELAVTAHFADWTSSDSLRIMVAGPALATPVAEHFTTGFGICTALDLAQYDPVAMGQLSGQDYSGHEEQFRTLGLAEWYGFEEPGEIPQHQLQIGLDGYGRFELDAVLTQPILVPAEGSPTLSLEHHCNVSGVLQRILASSDNGQNWQPLLTTGGSMPPLGGFILPHTQLTLDLSPYAGEELIVMFLLAAESGSEAVWHDFDWGWWLDVLSFGEDGWIDLPEALIEDPQALVFGWVPGSSQLSVAPQFPAGLMVADWWLDYPAYQIEQPPDQHVHISGAPLGYVFELGDAPYDSGNVEVRLHLRVTDLHGNISDELRIPAWQYNLAGDVNADGVVDAADSLALQQHLRDGLAWRAFADCNLDGVVDERDNAVIGYMSGSTAGL